MAGFIINHGPAKSYPTNADPIDRSTLANHIEPFIRKLMSKHAVAERIHKDQVAKLAEQGDSLQEPELIPVELPLH